MSIGCLNKQYYSPTHTAFEAVKGLSKVLSAPEVMSLENDDAVEKEKNVEALAKAIENRESIVIRSNGTWYKNRWIVALFRRLIGKNETLLTARQLARYLSKPILVKGENFQGYTQNTSLNPQQINQLVQSVRKTMSDDLKKEDTLYDETKKNREILKNDPSFTQSELVEFSRDTFDKKHFPSRLALADLERAEISSYYLGKSQENIATTAVDRKDESWMKQMVAEWQERTFPTINFLQGSYRRGTLEKIQRVCKYKKFIEAARLNPLLLDFLFHAILRNSPKSSIGAVDVFLQTPVIQSELHRSYIDTRIQHIKNNGLKMEEFVDKKTGKIAKDVTLLIGGTQQSITDPSKVVKISEKVEMTVKKLFDLFKKGLDRGFIEYEYLQDTGISAFDGRCRNIDLTKKDWWKEIPVVERLTREEVSEKYDTDFSKGHSLFVLRASRKYADLHAKDTHGWIDLLLPLEDGTFNCISVGKFTTGFPVSDWEAFNHILKAHPAEMTVVDPNKFYGWRERVHYPFPPMNEETFSRCMEKIRKDFIRCREGKEYFEFQGNNCSKWVEETIKTVFPEFKLELFNTRYDEIIIPPLTPLLRLGNFARILICTLFLGAWRGYDFKNEDGSTRTVRLLGNAFWRRGWFRIPGRICEKDRGEEIRNAIAQLPQETFSTDTPQPYSETTQAKILKRGTAKIERETLFAEDGEDALHRNPATVTA